VEVSEPPRIVVENRASCGDSERAEELLREALAPARAPGHAWTVTMRVEATPSRALRAEGQISDGMGFPVADRILSVPAGDCRGLARAVGVWASLVLEQELAHEHAPVPATPAAVAKPADSQSIDVLWPAPAVDEKPPPEHEWYLHHDDARTLEIGASSFLMAGAGAGAMAGGGLFAIFEAGHGVFLRPSLYLGESLSALNQPPVVHALWTAARFDTCLRLPGFYTQNKGIQLDMCGGADLGLIDDSTDSVTVPFVSVGPSIDLRGELGGLLSAVIRGVAGLNVTSETVGALYEPLWSGRLELAFSWKVK
jgi:hypothetical protein